MTIIYMDRKRMVVREKAEDAQTYTLRFCTPSCLSHQVCRRADNDFHSGIIEEPYHHHIMWHDLSASELNHALKLIRRYFGSVLVGLSTDSGRMIAGVMT